MSEVLWSMGRGLLTLVVPVFKDPVPFGPRPLSEVLIALSTMTALCGVLGHFLTRSSVLLRLAARAQRELRDEAWEEHKLGPQGARDSQVHIEEATQPRQIRKRTATELLFIAVHNGAVSSLAALAWALGSPALALYAFSFEVAYEIFDTVTLRLQRLEPETLIHHTVSPICIICSMQTEVDYRVLCHLCFCIDFSGAALGYAKFLLHYAHVSASRVYRNLMWVYLALRVVLPLIDTVIIVRKEVIARGGLFAIGNPPIVEVDGKFTTASFVKTDWTQLYFWAIAVLNAFNCYFFCVIRARAHMPPHLVASFEARTGCH